MRRLRDIFGTTLFAVVLACLAVLPAGRAWAGIIVTLGDGWPWLGAARVSEPGGGACDDADPDDHAGDDALDDCASPRGDGAAPAEHHHGGHGHVRGGVSAPTRACHDEDSGEVVACPPWDAMSADDGPPGAWGCEQLAPGVYRCELPGEAGGAGSADRGAAHDVVPLGCGAGGSAGVLGFLVGLGLLAGRRRR